jgi:galactarate dehydratase
MMSNAVIIDVPVTTPVTTPHTIRMHERDNVVIVANDGGLPPGTVLPSGLALRDRVPQGHKVALVDVAAGAPVLRYGIPIGYAVKDIPAGSWVHERLLQIPAARELDNLPIATVKPEPCLLLRANRDGAICQGTGYLAGEAPRNPQVTGKC